MLDFLSCYSYTHTVLLAKFFAGDTFAGPVNQQVFPTVYFLFNLSLYVKLVLAVLATSRLGKGLSFKQQVWLGYYDLIALDFVQAYCFFEYFETIHLGELITPLEHYLTAVPVVTLLVLAAYQLMTVCKARNAEAAPIQICRWALALAAGLVVLICLLKILYILTGRDCFLLFSR